MNIVIRITRNISRILGYSLNKISYKKAIEKIDTPYYEEDRVYPNIIPGWDNSPRRGPGAFIFHKATPALFKKHVKMILNRIKINRMRIRLFSLSHGMSGLRVIIWNLI